MASNVLPDRAPFGEGGAHHGHPEEHGRPARPGARPAGVTPIILKLKNLGRLPVAETPLTLPLAQTLEPCFVRAFPYWKRAIDIAGSLAGIVAAAPLMLAVAVAIRATSRGPVIFSQQRGGRGAKPFRVYKFRTMVQDAEARKQEVLHLNERQGPVFKIKNDPRITTMGRILRKLSLDELPQLFNVLKGDMSLVGPRPLPVQEDEELQPWQRMRLTVKPGITGLWQVTSRDKSCFDEWVRLDIRYIRCMSFWMDIKILLMTIPAVLSRKGAH